MMKKIATILMLIAICAMTAMADGGKSRISFVEKSHDFGVINEADGKASYKFRFTNDGDAPLIIISATAQCGCTKPTYTLEPIAPGEDGFLKVTYDPAGRPGEFVKTVKVKTNDPDNKSVKIKISGTVIPRDKEE